MVSKTYDDRVREAMRDLRREGRGGTIPTRHQAQTRASAAAKEAEDSINSKYGSETLRAAASNNDSGWFDKDYGEQQTGDRRTGPWDWAYPMDEQVQQQIQQILGNYTGEDEGWQPGDPTPSYQAPPPPKAAKRKKKLTTDRQKDRREYLMSHGKAAERAKTRGEGAFRGSKKQQRKYNKLLAGKGAEGEADWDLGPSQAKQDRYQGANLDEGGQERLAYLHGKNRIPKNMKKFRKKHKTSKLTTEIDSNG